MGDRSWVMGYRLRGWSVGHLVRGRRSEGIRSSQFAADSSQEARIGIEIYALGLAPSMIFENLGARIQNEREAPGFYRR